MSTENFPLADSREGNTSHQRRYPHSQPEVGNVNSVPAGFVEIVQHLRKVTSTSAGGGRELALCSLDFWEV